MPAVSETSRLLQIQHRWGACQTRAAGNISSNDFRPGTMIEMDGAPYRVMGNLPATAVVVQLRTIQSSDETGM